MKQLNFLFILAFLGLFSPCKVWSQSQNPTEVKINPKTSYQTMAGFGASLAFYEGWLTAHPNKSQIYDAIFGELSLDILRVRNAYDYDATMISKVKEFSNAAQNRLGKPIDILVSSWGPPAYLKSNNDAKNGGTLKYSVADGKVNFNYSGFAEWWDKSLDNYNANGIFPTYISIQNEPDYEDTWETCLLRPSEVVTATDTIAGYNKALDAVYDTIQKRDSKPRILGPETAGFGFNSVQNYVNALDVSKLYGIAHHLYNGVDVNNPYASTNFATVGNIHKSLPHFQTEFSGGNWYSLAGLIYKSLYDENVVAYLYWDLIWTGGGLVSLDFPWDRSQWGNSVGYIRTKEFYTFKQFSAHIHPGWRRVESPSHSLMVKTLAFISADGDSAAWVAINTSSTSTYNIRLAIDGKKVIGTKINRTSETDDCIVLEGKADSSVLIGPKSVTTVSMVLADITSSAADLEVGDTGNFTRNYPNPFTESTELLFSLSNGDNLQLKVFDLQGKLLRNESLGFFDHGEHRHTFYRNGLHPGIYFYRLESGNGEILQGKMAIGDKR